MSLVSQYCREADHIVDECVAMYSNMVSYEKPTEWQYRSVYNWISDEFPEDGEFRKVITRKDDFVTIRKAAPALRKSAFESRMEALLADHPKLSIIVCVKLDLP